jgi:hypothetical protein
MEESPSIKPPKWFYIVAGVALVWNLMGVIAYLQDAMITEAEIAALPAAEQIFYQDIADWAVSAYAFAVWGGFVGCLLLLLRKKWATPVLIVSLLGVLVQMYHAFFIVDSMAVFGPGELIMPIMVVAISIYLVYFSRQATANDWIS